MKPRNEKDKFSLTTCGKTGIKIKIGHLASLGGWVDTSGLRPPAVRPNHLAAPWRRRAPVGRASNLGRRFRDPQPIS